MASAASLATEQATSTSALLDNPRGAAVDSAGNLFIVEAGGHIRKVSSSGIITTVAGNGAYCNGPPGPLGIGDGGPATAALLCFGGRVAVDSAGNLFIADTVGGIPATVQDVGQAPGQPAGLKQINVQIPKGVQPGGYAPVALRVGDASSTDGAVWIAVSN